MQVENLRLDGDVERGGRFVREQERGLVGKSHRQHDALAHAAGKLMRIAVDGAFRRGDAHAPEQRHRALERLLLVEHAVHQHGLGELARDLEHRIERRHRVLEHHGDAVAAHVAQLFLRHLHDVAALEQDLAAGDAGGLVQQPHQRQGGDGFSGAGFADNAERLAGGDRGS